MKNLLPRINSVDVISFQAIYELFRAKFTVVGNMCSVGSSIKHKIGTFGQDIGLNQGLFEAY